MRLTLMAATATILIAGSAIAQQYNSPASATGARAPVGTTTQTAQTATENAPSNPAVKTTEGNNPGAPAAGANSFTEGQAKARIESRGFAGVTELAKDNNGLWKGKAMKDGKTVNVTLDYQGNVTVN